MTIPGWPVARAVARSIDQTQTDGGRTEGRKEGRGRSSAHVDKIPLPPLLVDMTTNRGFSKIILVWGTPGVTNNEQPEREAMSLMAMALLLSCRGPRQERRASGIIPGIVLSRTVAEKRERERIHSNSK